MSLLKRNGKSKKLSEQEKGAGQGSNFLVESPPSPSQSSKLFRKSTSIEPASGSDVERPNSQQSGRSVGGGGGGKKKKFPGFLSKVFGNNGGGAGRGGSKIPAETVEEPIVSHDPPLSIVRAADGAAGAAKVNSFEEGEVAAGGGRSISRESINSVESSSSFSFVNAKNIGGKRVKGKRIPVDDPSYGRTGEGGGGKESASDSKKTSEGGGISSTLERIGAKIAIGLKMKYNLQSCESLQYIDAVDEPSMPPIVSTPKVAETSTSPPSKSSAEVESKKTMEKSKLGHAETQALATQLSSPTKTDLAEPPPPSNQMSNDILIGISAVAPPQHKLRRKSSTKEQKKIFSESTVNVQTQAGAVTPRAAISSNSKSGTSEVTSAPDPPKTVPIPPNVASALHPKNVIPSQDSPKTVPDPDPATLDPVPPKITHAPYSPNVTTSPDPPKAISALYQPKIISDSDLPKVTNAPDPPKFTTAPCTPKVTTAPDPPKVTTASDPPKVTTAPDPPKVTTAPDPPKVTAATDPLKVTTAPDARKVTTAPVAPKVTPAPDTPKVISVPDPPRLTPPSSTATEEPQPSTSASALAAQNMHLVNVSNSNTWSNSGRRKRKAPQPPHPSSDTPNLHKFTNGVSSTPSSDVVTELQNDVPCSTSQAAMLKKFSRIEESPPPPNSSPGKSRQTTCDTGTFEIRPRKQERSVEPMIVSLVTRPTSSFASTSTTNSNTLFSRSHNRYHKRSCSEGQGTSGTNSNSNTGTRGRVHKQGKKKAPPPPNPFGDPDALGDEEVSAENSSNIAPNPVASTSTSIPPKVSTKQDSCSTSASRPEFSSSPFEEEALPDNSPPASISLPPLIPVENTSTSTTSSNTVTTPTSIPVEATLLTHDECLPADDLMDEIRQNMLNDQQEVQQLGLIIATQDDQPNPLINETILATSVHHASIPSSVQHFIPSTTSNNTVTISTSGSSATSTSGSDTTATTSVILRRSNVISETDIQSAQHALEVLTASIPTPISSSSTNSSTSVQAKPQGTSTEPLPSLDPQKMKLVELKKEAEKSPLNKSRTSGGSGGKSSGGNTSRPISIGSSIIYESPLAILLGKATGNTNHNADSGASSGGESTSPKITPKTPWYKQLSPAKYYRQHTTPVVKPFSALVKFSELDKEAAKIVEENRRKSEERRLQETERELMELFAATGSLEEDGETATVIVNQPDVQSTSTGASNTKSPPQTSSPPHTSSTSSSPSQVTSTSSSPPQVTSTSSSPPSPPSNTIFTAAQVHSTAATEEEDDAEQERSSSRTQDNSSPTFQSVHAASKHRKIIKPLLTSSPKNNLRSEKLAIVQPQTQVSNALSSAPEEPSSLSTSTTSSSTITTTIAPSLSIVTPRPPQTNLPISNGRSDKPNNEWDCPRCTLKNPGWRILCEICFQRKDPLPVTSTSTSLMSSIFQRVNAESSNIKSAAATISSSPSSSPQTSSSTTVIANTTIASPTSHIPSSPLSSSSTSTSSSCIPLVVEDFRASFSSSALSTTLSHPPLPVQQNSTDKPPPSSTIANIPLHCENFLSQLPAKDDIVAKKEVGELLVSSSLNTQEDKHEEDPELEELDIGKLRKARLAYFQKHQPSIDECNDSTEKPVNISSQMPIKNDLDRSPSNSETNELLQETTPHPPQKNLFADNEDDFIDYMLQLDENKKANATIKNLITNEESASIVPSTSQIDQSSTQSLSSPVSGNSPTTDVIPQIQRFRPKLEAIREGNSQDYTYCYSSSEIAQIYENWQASCCNNGNINSNTTPNTLSSQASTSPSLVHHHYPRFLGPSFFGFATTHSPVQLTVPQLPALLQDHQPYANNRLSDSGEQNYVNTSNTLPLSQQPPPTPLLHHESVNFPPAFQSSHAPYIFNGNNIILSEGDQNNFHCESNNVTGAGGSVRRLTYEDYRRMGAIPKGFPVMMGSRDDWSSESSSSSSDFPRGLLQFGGGPSSGPGGRGSGNMPGADCSPGITRRGTLDFPAGPSNSGYPDPAMTVSKLMQRLEVAIAQGDHRLAATLAHDMALMKVNCVVGKINKPFSIRVYVEDRFMQQGPFLVQVTSMMTVRDLKTKIERDWGIPAGFQRWILGRKMAEDDNSSLTSFEITQDSMAFLFLVTPDMANNLPSSSGGTVIPLMIESKVSNNSCAPTTDFTSSLSRRNIVDKSNTSFSVYNNIDSSSVIAAGSMESLNVKHSPAQKPKRLSNSSNQSNTSFQTPSTVSATTSKSKSKPSTLTTKEPSPPPLPPKSPIPLVTPCSEKSASSTDTPPRKSAKPSNQNVLTRKETGSNSQLTADTISAASALTQSLQQKLSEFKAVAEQTFGKANVTSLPPKQQPRNKEQSPAPPSQPSKKVGSHHESSPKRKLDAKEEATKPPVRRNALKSQLSKESSTSKEKLPNSSNTGSREKLPTSATTTPTENRFNGILLQTPKPDESVKPPERLDRAKKSEERSTIPLSNNTGSESNVKVGATVSSGSGVVRNESEEKNGNEVATSTIQEESVKLSQEVDQSSFLATSAESQAETCPSSAPQPKPRGIRKQATVEKVSQGTESPTVIVSSSMVTPATTEPSQVLPKPLPRTVVAFTTAVSSTTKPEELSKSEESSESSKHVSKNLQEVPAAGSSQETATTHLEDTSLQQEVKVDDFCQTTLPFPSAKYSKSSTSAGNLLLRPSAFVSQFVKQKSETGSPSSSAGRSPTFTPPTAIIIPSPAVLLPPEPSSSLQPPPSPQEKPEKSGNGNTSTTQDEIPSNTSTISNDDTSTSYLKMLELMEKQDLICNGEDAECPVCFCPVPKGQGIVLRDCLHVFCRECLVGCVEYADDSTVKCPFRDSDYACNNNLQEREIKALVPPQVFEKYLARSVKLAESKIVNTFHCKTPDCSGWCVFEDDVNIFLCPVCKKRNCLTCAAIHEGIDCHKYQRELAIAAETDEDAKQSRLMLEKMIQRGEALDCPACHVVLLKKWGCDWVRCSYCKTEICWVTKGFRWGPGGKGDNSGGCKCGVNGVKCHPKCTYCH